MVPSSAITASGCPATTRSPVRTSTFVTCPVAAGNTASAGAGVGAEAAPADPAEPPPDVAVAVAGTVSCAAPVRVFTWPMPPTVTATSPRSAATTSPWGAGDPPPRPPAHTTVPVAATAAASAPTAHLLIGVSGPWRRRYDGDYERTMNAGSFTLLTEAAWNGSLRRVLDNGGNTMRRKIIALAAGAAALSAAGGVALASGSSGSRLDDGKDLLPQARITEQQAISAAQGAASGGLNEVDLEQYSGRLVFNVDVGASDVKVDAATGEVVSTSRGD